jgi:transposase
MTREFDALYAQHGRPSIPPERLLRAQLLQLFYSIRSERLLMEQLDYNILFRWFVGLEMDEPVWVPTVFTKNRDRLLQHAVAHSFFQRVVARASDLMSGATFAGRTGRTTRMRRRRIPTRGCIGSRTMRRRAWPIWGTC